MLWGQSYVLPMTWGGGGIWGAPFGRHAALWLFHCISVLVLNSPESTQHTTRYLRNIVTTVLVCICNKLVNSKCYIFVFY